jgi:hypothetical protein
VPVLSVRAAPVPRNWPFLRHPVRADCGLERYQAKSPLTSSVARRLRSTSGHLAFTGACVTQSVRALSSPFGRRGPRGPPAVALVTQPIRREKSVGDVAVHLRADDAKWVTRREPRVIRMGRTIFKSARFFAIWRRYLLADHFVPAYNGAC